jgi:hypothetical protein
MLSVLRCGLSVQKYTKNLGMEFENLEIWRFGNDKKMKDTVKNIHNEILLIRAFVAKNYQSILA